MKFIILMILPFVNGYGMKQWKNVTVEGVFLDRVLLPHEVTSLVSVLYCSQMKDCRHVFMNGTGIFFLTSLLDNENGLL